MNIAQRKIALFLSLDMFPKSRNVYFVETKSNCGSATDREELWETYPNQINSFKRDFKNQHFIKKWILDGILPAKINFLPKTKMVRTVHMNTFGMMDLGKMEI